MVLREQEVLRVVPSPSQIEDTCKTVWQVMIAACKDQGLPIIEDKDYGSGYLLPGNIPQFVRAIWPGTNLRKGHGKTAMNSIRQFLKTTGNAIAMPYKGNQQVFVRAYWASRVAVPVFVGVPGERLDAHEDREREQRRKEAKVTPEEAGETLPPAPVNARQGEIISHPQHGKGTRDNRYPNIINFSNGYSQCIVADCGKVFEKRTGISSHVRMHAEKGVNKEVEALREEIATLKIQADMNLAGLDSSQALDLVTAYVSLLKNEVARLTTENDTLKTENETLKAQPISNGDAEAKVELIREVLIKVQEGKVSMIRGLSDINDALEG